MGSEFLDISGFWRRRAPASSLGLSRWQCRWHRELCLAFALLLPALLWACRPPPSPFVWASQLEASAQEEVFRLGAGDEIHVLVADQAALSGRFKIGPDGRYAHPVVGSVALNGFTLAEAGQQLAARLGGIVVNPQVTVSVAVRRLIRVSVLGEVRTPGRFEVPYDEAVLAMIARAGGLSEFADKQAIYVVRSQPHVLRIRFRLRDLAGAQVGSARFRLRDGDVIIVE